MNLTQWAKSHRLKVKADADDTEVIPGRSGSIWQYSSSRLGLSYAGSVKMWNRRRDMACAIGMRCTQNGDEEGNLTFDPRDAEQSRLAIKMAEVRPKRTLSPEHKAKLAASNRHNRFATVLTGQ